MNKEQLKSIANNTLDIAKKGYYHNNEVIIKIEKKAESSFHKDVDTIENVNISKSGKIEFENTSIIDSIITHKNDKVAALNFASAKNPGGGFLNGAKAQEESIARSSNLYYELIKFEKDFYMPHRKNNSSLYTDSMIYSQDIAVFRDDSGKLLPYPIYVNIITSPAVNAGVARDRGINEKQILSTMQERIRKVIHLAAQHDVETLILGAWGCGVFKNKEKDIASMFNQVLEKEKMKHHFEKVIFSIYDSKEKFNEFKGYYINA